MTGRTIIIANEKALHPHTVSELKHGEEKAISRKPRRVKDNSINGVCWVIDLINDFGVTIFKQELIIGVIRNV